MEHMGRFTKGGREGGSGLVPLQACFDKHTIHSTRPSKIK
jgi:hypothetical protein